MSYLLPHLRSGWAVDQAILSEEDRVVCLRFGRDGDETCMRMDEVRKHDHTRHPTPSDVSNLRISTMWRGGGDVVRGSCVVAAISARRRPNPGTATGKGWGTAVSAVSRGFPKSRDRGCSNSPMKSPCRVHPLTLMIRVDGDVARGCSVVVVIRVRSCSRPGTAASAVPPGRRFPTCLLSRHARTLSVSLPTPVYEPPTIPLTRVATSPRFPPRRSLQSLASCSEKVKNFAIIYCVDIDEVRAHRVLPFVLESRVLSTGKVWLLLAALCPSLNLVSRAACASPQYSRHAVGAG